ncbi:PP2C family protein-serine/threonine phosphatase [Streptomyces sp. ODS05-4]|uniref:PP2C family protein-serine/threonine phosphatase n=1 Tax=Streptomyces sp. ODS05-4 TaxID=2944939 RepID=UPI00210CA536|nr:PP2C family protein-serine/threonine phosphatase [Streptomyces sp. ODS05-4]
MPRFTVRSERALGRTVRRIAVAHDLAPSVRARLVATAVELAAETLSAGDPVRLTARPVRTSGASYLELDMYLTQAASGDPVPLPPVRDAGGRHGWRLPLPPPVRPAGPAARTGVPGLPALTGAQERLLAREETRAVIAEADLAAVRNAALEGELTAANDGALALHDQWHQRNEELHTSYGTALSSLERALRPRPLRVPGLELAVHYAPASERAPTGGDLYDWFVLPDGSVHITLVDALGHGVTSTRTAVTVTHTVRTLVTEGHSLDSVIARADAVLRPYEVGAMATVLLLRIDPRTGDLSLANGSHPPPLLLPAGARGRYLHTRGRGVGYPDPGSEGTLGVRLDPGDLLLLYTDGLTESRRHVLEGERRLLDTVREHRARPTASLPHLVATAMLSGATHLDDTLAIAVRFTGPGPRIRSTVSDPECRTTPAAGRLS